MRERAIESWTTAAGEYRTRRQHCGRCGTARTREAVHDARHGAQVAAYAVGGALRAGEGDARAVREEHDADRGEGAARQGAQRQGRTCMYS